MPSRAVVLIACAALIGSAVPPSAAVARSQRQAFGPAQGVQATADGPTVEIRFTGASAAFGRALAGQPVAVDCAAHPLRAADALLLAAEPPVGVPGSPQRPVTVAADGSGLRATLRIGAPGDVCTVSELVPAEALGTGRVAEAAITPAGATWIDERQRATDMLDLLVASAPSGTYPSADRMVALGNGDVVALSGPDATPPPGKIGWWSHGRAMALVTLSAAGHRLVLQDLGGGMLRTDVLEALRDWTPPPKATAGASATRAAARRHDDTHALVAPGEGLTGHRTGATRGVELRWSGPAAKAYRRAAGHRARVACAAAPPPPLLGETPRRRPLSTQTVRVPRHGGILRAPAITGARDVCILVAGSVTAFVPITRAGHRYVDPLIGTARFDVPFTDGLAPTDATAYPSAAAIAAAHRGAVALATPGQRVPAGRVGVWTDGAHRALYAATLPSGLRLVLADDGDGTIRTNMMPMVLAQTDELVL